MYTYIFVVVIVMSFRLMKALSAVAIVLLTLCYETEQLIKTDTTRIGTKSTAKIMKAFFMQCPYNFSSHNNVQVTVQIAMHTLTNKVRPTIIVSPYS